MRLVPHRHMTATERRLARHAFENGPVTPPNRYWGKNVKVRIDKHDEPGIYEIVRWQDGRPVVIGWIATDEAADGVAERVAREWDKAEMAAFGRMVKAIDDEMDRRERMVA